MISLFLLSLTLALASPTPSATAKTIKCKQVDVGNPGFGLQLRLVNSLNHPPSSNDTLPSEGIVLDSVDGNYLYKDEHPDQTFEVFGFQSCNSTYMGWNTTEAHEETETHYYGQFGTTDDEGEGLGSCITIDTSNTSTDPVDWQKLNVVKCPITDDKSQSNFWFSAIVPKDKSRKTVVRFIGQRESTYKDDHYYQIGTQLFGDQIVATASYKKGGYANTHDFQLQAGAF